MTDPRPRSAYDDAREVEQRGREQLARWLDHVSHEG
jgi:hypothetical protein